VDLRERRTDERNRGRPRGDFGRASAHRRRLRGGRPAAHSRALSALAPHLSGWEPDQVDLEVSLKDTEGPDQKVTLQAWLAGRSHLVATSHERDLDHALAEVRSELIRQIEDEKSRREPRKRRKTRNRTS
jgi:ribosome-associated translation inhibitor RaiA